MLQDPKAYLLALVYFFLLGATYTMVFWVPTLIQSWGVKDLFLIGIYASIPNAAGIIGMILIGRHSDKWHERRWHFAVCVVIAGPVFSQPPCSRGIWSDRSWLSPSLSSGSPRRLRSFLRLRASSCRPGPPPAVLHSSAASETSVRRSARQSTG